MKKPLLCFTALILLALVVAGCGTPPAPPSPTETESAATPTSSASETETQPPAPSDTPDPCVLPQLETEVQNVHRYMREFDDASTLAGSIPRDQLGSSIADLQRIRREAEDEQIPACLSNLRKIQVGHMNSVINSLLIFVRASDPQSFDCAEMSSTEEEAFCQSFSAARQQHDQYTLELARILGITVVPASVQPLETPTP